MTEKQHPETPAPAQQQQQQPQPQASGRSGEGVQSVLEQLQRQDRARSEGPQSPKARV